MASVPARLAIGALALIAATLAGRPAAAFDPRPDPTRYAMRTWGTGDGLPVGIVLAALQTRDGYVWAGTEEGLVRFDGARFTVFNRRNTPAFGTNYVRALYEDPSGALWIGTYGSGLLRYAGGEITHVLGAPELGSDDVRNLAGDAAGAIYVGTDDGAVARYEAGHTTRLDVPESNAQAIAVAPDGALWIARRTSGVSRWDHGVWTHLTKADGLSSDAMTSIYAARDGAIYAGTKEGPLDRIVQGAVTTFREGDALSAEIYAMVEDTAGNLWLGTADGGLRRFHLQDGRYRTYAMKDGLPNDKVFTVFVDREGGTWAGTLKGLARLRRAAFTTYDDARTTEPGTFVWALHEDAADGMWVGTQARGVELHRANETLRYGKKDGLDGDEVATLEQDRKGNVWAGTRTGLNRIRDGKITQYTPKNGLPDASVYALYVDRNDDLWIGSYGAGLGLLKDGTFRVYARPQGFPIDHVNYVTEDAAGTLWVGGQEGAGTLVDGKFTPVALPPGDFVFALYGDRDGVMWIGLANSGLARVDHGKVTLLSSREGLAGDTVFSILEDAHDNLWMSANIGVFRIARADAAAVAGGQSRTIASVAYGKDDGMRTFECNGGNEYAGIRSRDGRMWFATTEGLAVVDPEHLPKNEVAPPVRIEEVRANHALARDGERLAAGNREFELRYAAPSFAVPERVSFKYRLDGFDADWVAAGTRRVAYYTNLAPGTYTFRVIAANDDGVWNETGARFTFSVAPYFHETRSFWLGLAIAAFVATYGVYRLRTRQLRARAAELAEHVRARTIELSHANTELEAKDRKMQRDLMQAQAFQRGLLSDLPAARAVTFASAYLPTDVVGGDLYDVCEVAPDCFRLFVADTTGHGVQASLRTMVLKTEYDRLRRSAASPAALLSALNAVLVASFPALEMRCSAVCVDIAVEGGRAVRATYANAAHPPMLHVGPGEVAEVYVPSAFLGMMDDPEFEERVVPLAAGDRLLLMTDGLLEQENDRGETYGIERVRALAVDRAIAIDALAQRLADEVRAFAPAGVLSDDVAIVIAECALR